LRQRPKTKLILFVNSGLNAVSIENFVNEWEFVSYPLQVGGGGLGTIKVQNKRGWGLVRSLRAFTTMVEIKRISQASRHLQNT
jgi:hypothetical protein